MHFKRHFLTYTVVPLLILMTAASYYRFMVSYDYLVYHEGACDPYTQNCFVYCEDDACEEPFYYTEVIRRADSLRDMCGDKLVPDCEVAQQCQSGEPECEVTECSSEVDLELCEHLTEIDRPIIQDSV